MPWWWFTSCETTTRSRSFRDPVCYVREPGRDGVGSEGVQGADPVLQNLLRDVGLGSEQLERVRDRGVQVAFDLDPRAAQPGANSRFSLRMMSSPATSM